jgi:two-component system phosphate regulon sensor histidine kinase PhoR
VGSPWRATGARILGLLLVAALLGWASGQVFLVLFITTLVMLGWHLLQLYRLEYQLRAGSDFQRPELRGVWGEVYHHLFQLNKLLGLYSPQDLGERIVSLVRHPLLVGFLNKWPQGGSVEFPSPVNADLLLSVRIIPYGQGQRLLLATDISRVHRLEQIRRDFVANVSHELRTPLTVISGYLEALLDSEDTYPSQWRQPLRTMHQQCNRMLHIIEDLLMLSRLETQAGRQHHRPVAVAALLATIVEDATTLSGERAHEIWLEVDSTLWIRGCEQELRSAFSNLVFNAVRYTPDKGRIIIRWFEDERGIHLEVEDNGEGIPLQHIPRLTERFYRVDRGRQRESGGTGLGLAIVKHVMNRHNGQLRITSQVGVGSIFACDFPAQQRVEAGLSAAARVKQ